MKRFLASVTVVALVGLALVDRAEAAAPRGTATTGNTEVIAVAPSPTLTVVGVVRHSLCDPGSLQASLTALDAQKSAIETQLVALESSIEGAELGDATVCDAAWKSAVAALTFEGAAAAILGDLALEAELTSKLETVKQSPGVCDPGGVATLTSVLRLAESELATVDLGIEAVLQQLESCVSGQ